MKKKLTHLIPSWNREKTRQWLMRLTVLKMVLLMSLLTSYGRVNSQMIISNLKLQEVELSEALQKIEEQTDYDFVFSYDDVEGYKVSVDLESASLEECLEIVLHELPFVYDTDGDVVIVSYKKPLPVVKEEQEKKTIQGKVTDKDGIPLPGVSVVIKGTNIGMATDINGEYTMVLDVVNPILVYSFVGMLPQEISIMQQKIQDVTLLYDSEQMAEVVVTGYQTLSKERATGSFEKVSSAQIDKPSSNISERLVGQMAGVQATVNADGSVDFEIRGQSSLFAEAKPLIVIDGFPLTQEDEDDWDNTDGNNFKFDPFATINPNDIESVTVLKDAAAASIWGARSANGVIVITTKKAKKGQVNVDVSSFMKFSPKLDLDYARQQGSSADRIAWEKEAVESNFFGRGGLPTASPYSFQYGQSQGINTMVFDGLDNNPEIARLASLDNRKQIEDYLLQTPITQQHNINISGGSEAIQHRMSVMYEEAKDYFKENKNNKFMVNYKTNAKITKWMDFDFSGMIQSGTRTTNGIDLAEINKLAPYDMLVNADGSLNDLNHLKYLKPVVDNLPQEIFPYSDFSYNPITEIKNRERTSKDFNARLQAGLTLKLMEGLKFNSKVQYESYTKRDRALYNENTFFVRDLINRTSTWNGDSNVSPDPNLPLGEMLYLEGSGFNGPNAHLYEVKSTLLSNQLSFNRTFNEKHSINALIGTETLSKEINTTKNPNTFGYNDNNLSVGIFPHLPVSNIIPWMYSARSLPGLMKYTNKYTSTQDRFFSLYGVASYTYNDKYTFSASVRTDASNMITDDPKYRYSPFWSIGGSWQMHKESFMKEVDWLDRLNVRSTFGYNGNIDRSTSFKPLVDINTTPNPYTGELSSEISSYGNPTLRWEKTAQLDIAVDFSVLKGKLYGTIDFYNKKSTDLVVNKSIPSAYGTKTVKLNYGEMLNRGIELKLGTTLPILGRDIVWTGNATFSYNKNEIKTFAKTNYFEYELLGGGTSAYMEGKNANALWAKEYAGMSNFGSDASPYFAPAFYGPDGDKISVESYIRSANAHTYLKDVGTTVAPYWAGFSNSFKIYDFDFSFNLVGKFGHKFKRTPFNYPSMGKYWGHGAVNKYYSEVSASDGSDMIPMSPEGQNTPNFFRWGSNAAQMDYVVENASHIRLQEVNVTYNLPKNLCNKIGLKSLRVYAQGNNLGTILFNDYDEDPEYRYGTIKPQKSYTFGVKFNL
ncbi:MAG: SusC/RagA family TonB-linked outer membrane protein [Labilibaculum sp.]|nr:SusC/RagA family TonB-linked outer membrane protein [Labilibaculum sp.]MBI9057195.1 SusC/RagA family TonB-linked outer membrane protein [Labilibaculum sp.]